MEIGASKSDFQKLESCVRKLLGIRAEGCRFGGLRSIEFGATRLLLIPINLEDFGFARPYSSQSRF